LSILYSCFDHITLIQTNICVLQTLKCGKKEIQVKKKLIELNYCSNCYLARIKYCLFQLKKKKRKSYKINDKSTYVCISISFAIYSKLFSDNLWLINSIMYRKKGFLVHKKKSPKHFWLMVKRN